MAGRPVSIASDAEIEVLIVRLEPDFSAPVVPDASDVCLSNYEELITCYLHRAAFFRDDSDAIRLTNELFCNLTRLPVKSDFACQCPKLNRRLLRAIEKIRYEPGWDFNLQELASHSGVSERNLYYLMKRETGMTPYRLYQRNRLLRVRQRLVDCQCDVPHISWYAADAGFSHLAVRGPVPGTLRGIAQRNGSMAAKPSGQWSWQTDCGRAGPVDVLR